MELQEKIEELGKAFDTFKKANDQKLEEIEKKGHASSETTEKVEKVNAHIAKLEAKIEDMNAALARQNKGPEDDPGSKDEEKALEYKKAFEQAMRGKGEIPQELHNWARKTMTVDSDEDGGFFVTPEMSSEIVKKVFESSPIRELASQQTISSGSLELLHDDDEAACDWVGETGSRAATDTPTLNKVSIPVHELFANPAASQRLLDDAAVNLEAWLAGKVSGKFARKEATAFVSGNGVNKPKGILGYSDGDGFGLIERQRTDSATALDGDDFINIQSLLKEAYQGNATWLMNRLIIGEVRKLKDTTSGQYIWQPGLSPSEPNTLLGRPVRMATDLDSTLAIDNNIGFYGDFRAGYQVVDRVGIRVLRDPYSNKPHVHFYTTKRVGGGVKNFEAIKVLQCKAS